MSFRHAFKNPLGCITKNNSRNPTPGRRKDKELIPYPPAYPKPNDFNEKENQNTTFMINLEDLLIIERNLLFIFENFNNADEISKVCEELWDMTAENTLNQISNLYRDEHKRSIIRYSMVLLSTGIATLHFFISQYKLYYEIASILRTIAFYTHKSFLILTKFILSRVPFEAGNVWIEKLMVLSKENNKKKRKSNIANLNHYNKAICNNLKKVCRHFMAQIEDPTVKSFKLALLQIVRNSQIQVFDSRSLIEKAFGIKRESLRVGNMVKTPFLPKRYDKKYTLVLDLDETLVHYIENEEKGEYLTRPYAENFINEMTKYYEIIVFTAAVQDYADWILDDFDCCKIIDHRLYRQHTIPAGNYFLKDLNTLGRDLSKVIIVDNVAENFQLQPSNGILIKSWYDDAGDNALQELMPLLKEIASSNVEDVRIALSIYRQQMLEQLSKGIENPKLTLSHSTLKSSSN
ncbi:hypothetical protein SteCoe_15953 [Stentor coeruleus]|uniref:Mitochondrial import inner membrane translocase subunit TIM50 n=1 Tax=Stentor coeruleus TaxID=5963 RepID=A0A1R2C2L2_9CILI|nr:hypothetical protein SteCoe_15953 [Stentor coeruleus]